MRKIIGLSIATALTCTMAFAKEIKVGLILPMSGPVAAYGQNAEVGVKLAHKLQPKLDNGDTIKLVLVDNKGDKVETANAATRLISSDKAVAIIGAMISTNTAQVISIAEKKHIPVVAPAATNDKLTMRRKYANRVCFTDSFQGSVVANYAISQNKKKAVLVVDQATVYSLGLAKAFKKTYTKAGGKIIKKIRITSGDKDYKAIISQIKRLNPDIIFLPVYHPEASMFARQAKELGLKTTMISGDGVSNQTFIDLGGDAVNGYLYTDAFDYTNPPTKKSADFIKAYEKQTGSNALNSFSALGADTYYVLINAMNKCEDPSNSECINKEIKKTKDFQAVSGVISIDKHGDAIKSAIIKEIVDGKPQYKATVNP